MATYKVLQDIEAEDKLLGPLTLKQFIFAAIAIGIGFLIFTLLASTAPTFIKLPFALIMLPPLLVFGFLAAPIGRDQPNDIWLLARLRFLFRPRVRIWNQDGLKDLVTITAPKKEVHNYTDGLSHTEVKSRLSALASTLDSRGWAVKNVNANMFQAPGYLTNQTGSDRLVDMSQLPQEVSPIEVLASDDMLDPASNSTAQHLDQLVQQASTQIKQQARARMTQPATPAPTAQPKEDYWFMDQPAAAPDVPKDYATFDGRQVVAPGAQTTAPVEVTPEEQAVIQKATAGKEEVTAHMKDREKVLQPLHDRDGNIAPQPAAPEAQVERQVEASPPAQPAPPTPSPTAQALARDNNLSVATIAKQAKQSSTPDDGEVVISLH